MEYIWKFRPVSLRVEVLFKINDEFLSGLVDCSSRLMLYSNSVCLEAFFFLSWKKRSIRYAHPTHEKKLKCVIVMLGTRSV